MAKKEIFGIVISNTMDKTVVIKVMNTYAHSIYSKIITKTKNYLVHDEKQECNIGDRILVKECRPLSKKKRWVLVKIISKNSLI